MFYQTSSFVHFSRTWSFLFFQTAHESFLRSTVHAVFLFPTVSFQATLRWLSKTGLILFTPGVSGQQLPTTPLPGSLPVNAMCIHHNIYIYIYLYEMNNIFLHYLFSTNFDLSSFSGERISEWKFFFNIFLKSVDMPQNIRQKWTIT